MEVEPGATNVIPCRAKFPVGLRDLDAAKIDRIWKQIQKKFRDTDREENVETSCSLLDDVAPTLTDPGMQTAIGEVAASLRLATMDLPSAAVHDTQQLAKVSPVAMRPQQGWHQPFPKRIYSRKILAMARKFFIVRFSFLMVV
jgi:metal-dependent amidase/aminoacylase/carboxypeptidase family protein